MRVPRHFSKKGRRIFKFKNGDGTRRIFLNSGRDIFETSLGTGIRIFPEVKIHLQGTSCSVRG